MKPSMPRGFRVYKATNLLNGNFYIGVTGQLLSQRRGGHITASKGRKHTLFSRAILRHGSENFRFDEMYLFDNKRDAFDMEIMLISELNPAYNIERGGVGSKHLTGTKISDEVKKRISATMKKRRAGIPKETPIKIPRDLQRLAESKHKSVKIDDGRVFRSVIDAAAALGSTVSAVSQAAHGHRPHVKGFKVEYIGRNP